ncbi:MAG: hypothetical protein N2489_00325 [Clostridia bacterium]|nr:hypothetical protein [Clostridia bacterium]
MEGFKQVYLTVAIASLLALCILALYRKEREVGELSEQSTAVQYAE